MGPGIRRRKPRKRIRRRRKRKTNIPRMLSRTGMNGTHMIRQKAFTPFQIGALGLPQFTQFEFSLANVPQVATFQRLYDRYCIYGVSTRIIMNDFQPPAGNQSFTAAVSIDKDSVVASPPDWNAFIERANTKMKTMTTGYKGANELFWRQKPKPLAPLYKSLTDQGYQILPSNKPVWIDCADESVPHYGALVGFNNAGQTLNVPINCTMITTYWLGFQGIQ